MLGQKKVRTQCLHILIGDNKASFSQRSLGRQTLSFDDLLASYRYYLFKHGSIKFAMAKISIQVRELVIKDQKKGISKREIGRKYQISEGAVRKICEKFKELGIVGDKSGRGRKKRLVYWTIAK